MNINDLIREAYNLGHEHYSNQNLSDKDKEESLKEIFRETDALMTDNARLSSMQDKLGESQINFKASQLTCQDLRGQINHIRMILKEVK